jgi:adenylate cyclase
VEERAVPDLSSFARVEDEILGGPRVLSLADLAERLGVSETRLARMWHAFGLPEHREDKVFTEQDVAVLERLLAASDEHQVSPAVASSLVRSVAHLTDRLAIWQLEALVEHMAERHDLDDVSAREVVLERLAELVPVLEAQVVHAWRRQIAGQAALMAKQVENQRRDGVSPRLPLSRAVGFADIVSFTARTAGMTAEELADFVQAFESRARDVVSRAGGRTVKTIGDAIFFVAPDARHGAAVALDLADAFPISGATAVRVGVVWGNVLARFGDVYGTPVNVAARLTAEAAPGEVLVDEDTARLLADEPGLRLTRLAERDLAGVGPMSPSRLERA